MLAWHLGLRYLRKRRAAWLALGAIVLTVAVPIVVMGVMQGFVDVMGRQVRANEADVTLEAGYYDSGVVDSAERRAEIAAVPGVAGLAPFIAGNAIMTPAHDRAGASLRSSVPCLVDAVEWEADRALGRLLDPNLHRTPAIDLNQPPLEPDRRGTGFLTPTLRSRLALLGCELVSGLGGAPLPPRPTPLPGAVIGQELALLNGLMPGSAHRAGSVVRVLVPNGTGGAVGSIRVEIADTLGTGIYEVDRYNLIVPLGQGRRLTDLGGSRGRPAEVSGYRVRVADDLPLESAAMRLEEATGLPATPWTQRRGHLVKGLVQQRNIIGFVMILVQILAVFIVYAVFSTLVAEKRHDIGVLIGIGARRGQIAGAFLLACLAACIGGGLFGWGLGWAALAGLNPFCQRFGIALFPQDFFYSPDTPISYDPLIPLFFIGVMTSVGMLAAALPAWRAARTDPVATLRDGA